MERRGETGIGVIGPGTLRSIHRKLMDWFRGSRRDYPWRQTHNWFHLVIAELMLRRTRSDQVAAVYERFVKKYKNARAASKDPEGVQETIRSLGLNWRNEQIQETIQYLSHRYGNRRKLSPDEDLKSTPGVGDYCNAMLRSRLFQEPEPAIDSNVARIYCRLLDVEFHPEMRRKAWLKQLARDYMDTAVQSKELNDPFEINLALLDLAALVCKPGIPKCMECPIRNHCRTGLSRNSRTS